MKEERQKEYSWEENEFIEVIDRDVCEENLNTHRNI